MFDLNSLRGKKRRFLFLFLKHGEVFIIPFLGLSFAFSIITSRTGPLNVNNFARELAVIMFYILYFVFAVISLIKHLMWKFYVTLIIEMIVYITLFSVTTAYFFYAKSFAFSERRKALVKIVRYQKDKIGYAMEIITDSVKEAEKFYAESLKKGNEGVMVKNLDAKYVPGSRVGHGVKVKPMMETLDLVIVGAEWGTGKRANWLSSFSLACINPETEEFLEIGKLGTGVKEKSEEGTSFEMLTNLLLDDVLREKDKKIWVKPKIVLEVGYEEIQKSPTYGSGFALRFPRLIRLREDRNSEEIDSLERVKKLFLAQRGRR